MNVGVCLLIGLGSALVVGCMRDFAAGSAVRNGDLQSQLFVAVTTNDAASVKNYVAKGADVNWGTNGTTLLQLAAMWGHENVLVELLRAGADANRSVSGRTPLMSASWYGSAGCVRLLLEHGANPNVANRWGDSALSLAVREGHISIVRLLLDHGASVQFTNILTGLSPLEEALQSEQTEVVEMLRHAAQDRAK